MQELLSSVEVSLALLSTRQRDFQIRSDNLASQITARKIGLERINRKRNNKIDVFYRPILAISQKKPIVLYKIKSFIGCGSVNLKGKDRKNYHYRIRSSALFIKYLYPILKKNNFQTNKQLQFDILSEAIDFLVTKYEPNNLDHQIYLEKLDKKLREARLLNYCNTNLITLDWFFGFFEAEGCFYFNIDINNIRKCNFLFKVTQKNELLLKKIQKFFGYGFIKKERDLIYCFEITSFYTIKDKLFPILEKTLFHSEKNVTRIQWLKAFRLITKIKQNNYVASQNDLETLSNLKQNLNK